VVDGSPGWLSPGFQREGQNQVFLWRWRVCSGRKKAPARPARKILLKRARAESRRALGELLSA
jgi:hypothetical protein